ncbi:MAG: hypothetical protein HC880_14560 [Bacteroidia bacterium]|nr:hypothetical protein [Bacteroidia bacterium]
MNASLLNRRNLLKKGALTLGALAWAPQDIWAKTVRDAQANQHTFLFSGESFNEFPPPPRREEELKAILRANENPYGPRRKLLRLSKKPLFRAIVMPGKPCRL